MKDKSYANDLSTFYMILLFFGSVSLYRFYEGLQRMDQFLFLILIMGFLVTGSLIFYEFFSLRGKKKRRIIKEIKEVPNSLKELNPNGVFMGKEVNLDIPIFLPDSLRARHIHILGATGSGKTESVILNFLRQDISRGLGAIILDAKGDYSFLESLNNWVPKEKLLVFDLGSKDSLPYNPLHEGSPLESAQRLFSSLNWSEEYYKSKAFTTLQKIYQIHYERYQKNPTLVDIAKFLETPDSIGFLLEGMGQAKNQKEKDFNDLSGLRDQINSLCLGHLSKTLSPSSLESSIKLLDAKKGFVIYFRLQSLMSPQLVSTLGKLIINHLNFVAGTSHRNKDSSNNLIPVYLDEFASFACPEFADLISKARSAKMALHFSHQSIGDLVEVSKGFLNRITDNSATKIVLRINDPDSADFFARSFGTKIYQKVTQRITKADGHAEDAEVLEEGTRREAHQFRASPDMLKTLPTGVGSVLIAHGFDTPQGASSVFKIKFPFLKKEEQICLT